MGIALRYSIISMRALIISDIHANCTALETILSDAGSIDQVWCLGDIVGYGPDPNECVSILRKLTNLVCVIGNHDAAVCGAIPHEVFNPEARNAIQWTRQVITPENLNWLQALPERVEVEGVTLVHGSPRNPVWEYLLEPVSAGINFSHFTTNICFVGHTHLPLIFEHAALRHSAHWIHPAFGHPMILSGRYIINPGSAGQPRDRDPRASYGIFDTNAQIWLPKRVSYNIKEVQKRIFATTLPERHATRLAEGW